jgi:hypothetical protein
MKTFVFIVQTAWLSDIDFAVTAYSVSEARLLAEKEWPPKNGHKLFFQYSY